MSFIAITGLILGIVNLILYYWTFSKDKPRISIEKLRAHFEKNSRIISLSLKIENQGYRGIGLYSLKAYVKDFKKTWFEPDVKFIILKKIFKPIISLGEFTDEEEILEGNLPMEIKALTPYRFRVVLKFYDIPAFERIISKKPIIVNVKLELPNKIVSKVIYINKPFNPQYQLIEHCRRLMGQ